MSKSLKISLEENFDNYIKTVYPGEMAMPDYQYIELKRAFFAGLQVFGKLLTKLGEDTVPDEVAIDTIDDVFVQITEFVSKQVETES